MIIVYRGCEVDAELDEQAADHLLDRIRGLFQSLKPKAFLGSLSAGADILFARAALEERGTDDVVEWLLPFETQTFKGARVEPAGEPWVDHYDRILSTPGVDVGHADLEPADADADKQYNIALLDRAEALARQADERIWILTVRPKAIPTSPTATDDLMQRATERGLLAIDLDPVPSAAKRAFVVMPYGKKKDPRANKFVECDPSFHRVYRPLLEDFDLDWTRADLQTDSGIIHAAMLSDLANSDLVIGDLSAINFNVAYELGIRHVFAARSTVLIDPEYAAFKRAAPPFDINLIRTHKFSRGTESVTDSDAENAIRDLRRVIQTALDAGENDSPCHEWFDLGMFERPFQARSALPQARLDQKSIRERVATATQSADEAKMLRAADDVAAAEGMTESARRACRIELAAGLMNEAAYLDAMNLLELAKPESQDPLHRTWLHKTLMAYRRVAEGTEDAAEKQSLNEAAKQFLRDAEAAGYRDSETYGIWGGLLKRQIEEQRGTVDEMVTQSLFAEMAQRYQMGFELDPEYYTGVNVVMALRWSGRPRDDVFAREFNEALTVSRFLARLALAEDDRNFYAAATLAELTLHEALELGTASESDAIRLYADAGRNGRPDEIGSAVYQLEFLRACGDRDEVIDRAVAALKQAAGGPPR
ncbi:tetratricopeptide repeat-containing protein [Mycobacterium deserti]|uniref:DUF4071 domain-containing protein n=1 Tax=Mycobacterium deserti TaxID=2978347 RepID=A0ABT2M8V7_9MYCO|nr:tetratricopeptide repeat-containing protein [Mycobacterium deserti]MCT7658044.1 hypothetical protein [Mycobacterium deserti]